MADALQHPSFPSPTRRTDTDRRHRRFGRHGIRLGHRLALPRRIRTAHTDTHGFTLDIVVATSTSATFNIATTTIGTSEFTIDGGAVDLGTGRLTIGGGTATLTESSVALAQATTFGFAGQIYGDTADAVGGTYWGRASDDAATFDTDADGNPFGGAFIASRSGIAATITYPQNFFDLATLSGDIDGSGGTGYGSAVGSRYRVATDGATGVTSSVLILSPTAGDDATTATIDADSAPNGVALAWLGTALEATASATAATGRDDGAGAAQTFTAAYTGTDVIEYRTNRTTGTAPNVTALDVASLYLINNAAADRIVVTGPDYGSQSYLSGQGGMTLSYGGRITAPQLLAGVGGTAHANTHGFTLDIVVATAGASATFDIATTTLGASEFTIDGGAVDLSTGRLTIGTNSATLTESSVALAQATTFGFAGQIYGATADAVGGTYWGRASDIAASFETDDNGKPFGGAFIASRSGIAATPVPVTYPQNFFDLATLSGDIDGSGGTGYGSATGSRYRVESDGATGVTSSVLILSPTAGDDATTATINADSAPNGVALAWLGTALEATASATAATGRDDGTGAAQTFTAAYTGTDVIEYRTNRTTGTAPNVTALDVASLYLINNAAADRIVVTGPDYGSQSYLSGQGGMTLSYGGRITAPQLLSGVGGTAHANTHGFTLDIVVATAGASATFDIATTTLGASEFTIDGGAVDLSTGRLTIGTNSATLTESSVALAQATTFGFAGQIYGATADAVGGTYWGRASDIAASFETDDNGKPFGGAFIASRSGIAATPVPVTYPQNFFDLATLSGDIDGSGGTGYGSATGSRYRVESDGATGVTSSVLILSPTAGDDATTATINADSAPNGVALAWLGTALEATASATAATGRDDGTGAAQTFTAAYTGTDVIEYRTNRTTGTAPNVTALDVASLYLINNAAADRIVVTGPDYGSQSYLSGQGGMTLSYGGRITAPQLLSGVGGTAHANTHGFTLDIVVATAGASATFDIATTTLGASTFTIDGGAVNLGTGRLTIGGGTATLIEASEALAQATTFGFAGQIYGDTADAVGGTYWGRANDDAGTFNADDDGNPFGGAFIASRSGIAATPTPPAPGGGTGTFPQDLFDLTTVDADLDNYTPSGGAAVTGTATYGSAAGSRHFTQTSGGTPALSEVIIISPTLTADASTATINAGTAPNGVALPWLGTALQATLVADTARADGTGAAQSFSSGFTASDVVAYSTNRSGVSQVATLYFIDDATVTDRIAVAGPDYASNDWFDLGGADTMSGRTLTYTGRFTDPQLLGGIHGTTHANTHSFSLAINVGATSAASSFSLSHFRLVTETQSTAEDGFRSIDVGRRFSVQEGAVNFETGRLTLDAGSTFTVEDETSGVGRGLVPNGFGGTRMGDVAVRQGYEDRFKTGSSGLVGQIFGNQAQALGGAYWGVADKGSPLVDDADDGKLLGGAFIATLAGNAKNTFKLAQVGSAVGTHGVGKGELNRGSATSEIYILSPTISTDVGASHKSVSSLSTILGVERFNDTSWDATIRDGGGTATTNSWTVGVQGSDGSVAFGASRTSGAVPGSGDVATLYYAGGYDGEGARIIVTGPEYNGETFFSGQANDTEFEYLGRLTLPRQLGGTYRPIVSDDTVAARLVVTTQGASSTVASYHFQMTSYLVGAETVDFDIVGGTVNLATGELLLPSNARNITVTGTGGSSFAAQTVFKTGSFGLSGQLFGAQGESAGFAYWGLGDVKSDYVETDDAPVGGAFIGTRPLAPAVSYPINTYVLSDDEDDIDGTAGTATYGAASGTRYFTLSGTSGVTRSEISILSNTAAGDVSTATAGSDTTQGADLTWLTAALGAISSTATADTARADSTDDDEKTFTTGYSATGVTEYRTNRTTGTAPNVTALDVASLYLVDNDAADRIVVTGPDYVPASKTYLEGLGGSGLSYVGRLTAPQLLAGAHGTTHANTHRFTLEIVVAAGGSSATFDIRHKSETGNVNTPQGWTSVFNIDDGEVDLDTGRLTLGNSSTHTVTRKYGKLPFDQNEKDPVNLYKTGTDTFGLVGQIYGDKAEAVGGTYWGQALGGNNLAFSADDDGKPFGGAFIASFAGTYQQNAFSLTGTPVDIDGTSGASSYGVGIGTRTRKESADSAVDSEIIVITGDASTDFSTATNADLPWLSTALDTAVTADSGRVDGTGAGQTFTVGYKAADSNVIEYRTNGIVGVSPLQVARLYLINNGDDDRLVVTGPDYNAGASETSFTARPGYTSTYTGRIFGAQLLGDVHGVNHEDSGLFTLSILAGTNSATSSFTLDGAYTYATRTNEFRIENGAIDFATGRLTVGSGSAAVTQRPSSGPGARVFKAGTFGFVGQLYGSGGEALGGTYWGVGDDAVNRVSAANDGALFGGAFIASRSALTAPAYPQSLFSLTATDGDIDNYTPSGGTAENGTSTYGVAAGAQFSISAAGATPTETSEIIILSNTAAANALTATPASGDTPTKGAAVDWIHATITAGAALTTSSGGMNFHNSFTDYASGNDVVVVRTSRTDSDSNPLDVAAVYVRAYGTGDRLVLAGENYAASSWFGTQSNMTLTYGGALILPTLLADFSGISPTFGDADAFTLTIDVKATAADSSFTITHSDAVSDSNALLNKFTITDGAVDFATGRLTVGSGSFSVTTESVAGTDVNVFKAGSLGFIGQIYGTEAESLGGAYWGVANGTAPTVATADDDKVYGGAFVASRSGIAATPTPPAPGGGTGTFPQDLFDLTTVDADLDNYTPSGGSAVTGTATYGSAAGSRHFTQTSGGTPALSEVIIISPTLTADASTATIDSGTAPNGVALPWLGTALQATLVADTARADGTGTAQSFSSGFTASDVVAYSTNRSGVSQVATMYFIDDATVTDRIAVAGPDYASNDWFDLGGADTMSGSTLTYTGRFSEPQLLDGVHGTTHASTHSFSLAINVGATSAASSFSFSNYRFGTETESGAAEGFRSIVVGKRFSVREGAVNFETGRLTLDAGSTFTVADDSSTTKTGKVPDSSGFGTIDGIVAARAGYKDRFKTGSSGLVGQIFGNQAQALGGAYWGVADKGSELVSDADDGKLLGGAFIATLAGNATNTFKLAKDTDIGPAASATHGVGKGELKRGSATSEIYIISPTITTDVGTSHKSVSSLSTILEVERFTDASLGATIRDGTGETTIDSETIGVQGSDGSVAFGASRDNAIVPGSSDVATMYFAGGYDGEGTRIIVTGPEYNGATHFRGQSAGERFEYVGRLALPRQLSGTHRPIVNDDTVGASLVMLTKGGGSTETTFHFEMKPYTPTDKFQAVDFDILGGKVDFATGALSLDSGTNVSVYSTGGTGFGNQNVFKANSFGMSGQLFGAQGESAGFVYWGLGDANSDFVETDNAPVGGAFVGTR